MTRRDRAVCCFRSFLKGSNYGLGLKPTLILIVLAGSASVRGIMALRATQLLDSRYEASASAACQHFWASSYSAGGPIILLAGKWAEISVLPLCFGLGDATKVDQVDVDWPSGRKQKLTHGLRVNDTMRIIEPKK